MSEFARLAIQEFTKVAAGDGVTLENRLTYIDRLLTQVNERLHELTCALELSHAIVQQKGISGIELP
jgi:hypothetical protein